MISDATPPPPFCHHRVETVSQLRVAMGGPMHMPTAHLSPRPFPEVNDTISEQSRCLGGVSWNDSESTTKKQRLNDDHATTERRWRLPCCDLRSQLNRPSTEFRSTERPTDRPTDPPWTSWWPHPDVANWALIESLTESVIESRRHPGQSSVFLMEIVMY